MRAYFVAVVVSLLTSCASFNRGDMGWSAEQLCGGLWQPQLPVAIRIMPSAETAGWGDDIRAAVAWWGPEFFTLSEGDSPWDVAVFLDPDMHGMALTQTRFNPKSCRAVFAVVTVPDEHTITPVPARVAAHELGHVLGLADDYDEDSVMHYRVTRHTPLECDLLYGDRQRLLDRYGRKARAAWPSDEQ